MAARYSEKHHVTFVLESNALGMVCRCGWHDRIGALIPKSSVLTIPSARMTAKHFQEAEARSGAQG